MLKHTLCTEYLIEATQLQYNGNFCAIKHGKIKPLLFNLSQNLCKFGGTKKVVYIRKEINSHRICLEHKHQ